MGRIFIFFSGIIFGLGLGISQMTRPQKILSFLNVLGDWDPSLLIVMASAIAVYYPFQLWIRRHCLPLCAEKYVLPKESSVDRRLVIGAAIFGIGWGALGLCPGPAVTILATGRVEVVIFILFLGLGMITAHKQRIF